MGSESQLGRNATSHAIDGSFTIAAGHSLDSFCILDATLESSRRLEVNIYTHPWQSSALLRASIGCKSTGILLRAVNLGRITPLARDYL